MLSKGVHFIRMNTTVSKLFAHKQFTGHLHFCLLETTLLDAVHWILPTFIKYLRPNSTIFDDLQTFQPLATRVGFRAQEKGNKGQGILGVLSLFRLP